MTASGAMAAMVWIGDANNGSIVSEAEALISSLDHGVTVGDGVFETVKVAGSEPFALTRHLRRLQRSCDHMGIAMPSAHSIVDAVAEVISANAPTLGPSTRLRITVTSGVGPLGSERSTQDATLIIAQGQQKPWPKTAELVTVPWTRNERGAIASVKSTSYAENVVALRYAHQHGASEGIFLNTKEHVCEGSGSNIFWVRDGVRFTPSLLTGCLAGITRELILEWFDVIEVEEILPSVLAADEVFITSATRDIQPVVRWDSWTSSEIGPVTAAMQGEFARRVQATTDP